MVRLIVAGACGRTGSAVLGLAAADPAFTVTHILEAANHPSAGNRIAVPDHGGLSFPLESDLESIIDDGDVVIDFTQPTASFGHFRIAAAHGKAIVVGTTGFSDEVLIQMKTTPGARAVISPNMSVGVNVLFTLARKAAEVLGEDYDVEIVEMHHKHKKDAPSGTAIRLRDAVTDTARNRQWIEVTGRQGIVGERRPDEIGVLAVRAGDIVGEHTVFFVGPGERIELTHRAYSRNNFAKGALTAAKWIQGQPSGIYSMYDVLGLH
jgi:4-hydroxy-tetrahydrodipicolinate reductase